MTERKPPGLDFESWVERQIREAGERGAFDDLPGAGKPLPDADQPYDELWWVRRKMAREGLSALPPSLQLRRDAQEAERAALEAPSERRVRELVREINTRVEQARRQPLEGPPLRLELLDEEDVVSRWRDRVRRRAAQ
ncbi:DUF1992 domain-containing protein [Streptomyces sp. NPDC005438]|uniref:DnaJ family domain-containing protein n=1 Tax=Streptomyces sp. NPDC005438 TaxID=3156880 RepID=UPI0033B3D242